MKTFLKNASGKVLKSPFGKFLARDPWTTYPLKQRDILEINLPNGYALSVEYDSCYLGTSGETYYISLSSDFNLVVCTLTSPKCFEYWNTYELFGPVYCTNAIYIYDYDISDYQYVFENEGLWTPEALALRATPIAILAFSKDFKELKVRPATESDIIKARTAISDSK